MTDEGFNITSMYDPQNLEKGSQDEMTQIMENITNEHFNGYIKAENKKDLHFDQINKHINISNLEKNNNDIFNLL